MKNIESAFRYIRLFTLVIVVGCLLLCSYVLYKSFQLVKGTQNKIYVLATGKAMEAFATDRKANIMAEAKDHIAMFHQFFFTLDPDDNVIQQNITKALYLADGSAKRQYENLKENAFYSNVISGNISQKINIDSIHVQTDNYPFFFTCYAKLQIIRPTSIVIRNLITQGDLRDITRSDHNSHGFLIEKWTTIENKDIKISSR